MKNKCLKIVGLVFVATGVVISLNIGVRQETNWEGLMRKNVEALTTQETENAYYPCVKARGYCLMGEIRIKNITFFE